MSLFVRIEVSFWTHRKTMRLRSIIGEAALWLPIRLWSYAAQNQSDGDFSDYSAEEIALLLGYQLDAQAMLQALHKAGFMHEMRIHDWESYNGYHAAYAERAKKAAAARWGKERSKEKNDTEKRGEEASIASGNATSIQPEPDEHPPGWRPPLKMFVDACVRSSIAPWYAEKKYEVFDAKEWCIGRTPANWKRMVPLARRDFVGEGSPMEPPQIGPINGRHSPPKKPYSPNI